MFDNFKRCSFLLAGVLAVTGCSTTQPTPQNTAVPSAEFSLKVPRYGHAAVADDSHIYVLGGSNKHGLVSSIEIIAPKTNETTLLKDMIIPRRYFSAVWDGKESIYIFGGVSDSRYVTEKTVEVFNTRTHKVTQVTDMPMPRRFVSATRIDDVVYLTGGTAPASKTPTHGDRLNWQYETSALNTAYNLNDDSWIRLKNLPAAYDTRTVELNGEVCAVGGYNDVQAWSKVACYNVQKDRWHFLTDLPDVTSAHSIVNYQGDIYSFGDYETLTRTLKYDSTDQTWSPTNLPYIGRRHTAAVVFNDSIYVIGGNTGSRGPFLDTVQVFDMAVE